MRQLIKYQKLLCSNLKNYIIIGAMDGIKYDHVFTYLSDRTDYRALFIEPVTYQYQRLLENTKKLNGTIYCDRSVILDVNETIDIISVNKNHLDKYPDFIDGCSSIAVENSPLNIFIKKVDNDHRVYETFKSKTFLEIVDKYKFYNVDYVQVDTEGCDHRIVDSIDFDKFQIKVLKFEKYYLPDKFVEYFSNKLKEKNYTTVIDGEDVLSVYNDYYDQIVDSINNIY